MGLARPGCVAPEYGEPSTGAQHPGAFSQRLEVVERDVARSDHNCRIVHAVARINQRLIRQPRGNLGSNPGGPARFYNLELYFGRRCASSEPIMRWPSNGSGQKYLTSIVKGGGRGQSSGPELAHQRFV